MEKQNFPTGSSGGGGKRGYGIRSFLHPTGEESPPNEVTQNNDTRTGENSRDRPALNEQNVVIHNWIAELDNARAMGQEEHPDSSESSASTGLGSNSQVNDGESSKSEERINERPGERFGFTVYNYAGYIGIPNTHGGVGFSGYVGAPVLGQGGLAIRFNGSHIVEYNIAPIANGGNLGGVQGDHRRNGVPMAQGQGQIGIIGVHNSGRAAGQDFMRNNNGNIFYYTTTTAYAHRRLNGDILIDMFSLRDAHIFNILNITDYAGPISQICNNPDLADAMINHIDCLKAMLTRNIPNALAYQISCVNAVMRLVNEDYITHEDWAVQLMQTVDYDLRIISDRASNRDCRSRPIIRYLWQENVVMVYLHPEGCQCNQPKNN